MKRVLRLSLGMLLSTVVLLAAVAGLLAWWSLPELDGERTVTGLSERVVLERDGHGVLTAIAANREDLARGLGYAHAQDRFFQMDLARRSAAGELAALLGPGALEVDRRQRRHRMRAVARQVLRDASAEERALLEAYAEGVNAGLQNLRVRPVEYLALRTAPKPWTIEDSVLVLHAMWFRLTDATGERKRRIAALRETLPAAVVDFILPKGTPWDAPLIGGAFELAPMPAATDYDLRALSAPCFDDERPTHEPRAAHGSNVWAVAGERGHQGHAWLANDMHLGLNVPNTWYRARLRMEAGGARLDIAGVTLPGLPIVVAGSNGDVAWGFANSYGDWVEVSEALSEGDSARAYELDGKPMPVVRHRERIQVRGGPDEALLVEEIPQGLIIEAGDRRFAVRWLARRAQASNFALLDLEGVATVEEALAVAQRAGIPPQSVVVADRDGNIGWTIAGRIPARAGEGWAPPEDYPRVVNPERGQIASANARLVEAEWLDLLGDGGYDLGARQRQIDTALASLEQVDARHMLALQLEDRAVLLERWRTRLLGLLEDETDPSKLAAHEHVTNWAGRAAVDDVGYRIVREWRDELHRRVFHALTAETRAAYPDFAFRRFNQSEEVLWRLVSAQPMHLLDPRYESWSVLMHDALEAVLEALRERHGSLGEASWGERNRLAMRHPLSGALPGAGRWLDMPATALSGDRDMPRVQASGFGASQRMAVSPGREHAGYLHMPGGQSGHPFSPYYRRGHEDWEAGRLAPFLPQSAEHTLRLVPAPE